MMIVPKIEYELNVKEAVMLLHAVLNNMGTNLSDQAKELQSAVRQTLAVFEMDDSEVTEIVVNGMKFRRSNSEATYLEIRNLVDQSKILSITYKDGHSPKTEGILSPGGKVRLKNGMKFNVSDTSNA